VPFKYWISSESLGSSDAYATIGLGSAGSEVGVGAEVGVTEGLAVEVAVRDDAGKFRVVPSGVAEAYAARASRRLKSITDY
jgi:hypothetical protein